MSRSLVVSKSLAEEPLCDRVKGRVWGRANRTLATVILIQGKVPGQSPVPCDLKVMLRSFKLALAEISLTSSASRNKSPRGTLFIAALLWDMLPLVNTLNVISLRNYFFLIHDVVFNTIGFTFLMNLFYAEIMLSFMCQQILRK